MTSSRQSRRRPATPGLGRLWPWLLVGVLAAPVALYAGAGFVAAHLVENALRRAGFSDAHVRPVVLRWDSATSRDVLFDSGGRNRIAVARAEFTPRGLIAGRIDRVVLEGVRLEVRPFGPGPLVPGWAPTPGAGSGAPAAVPPVRDIRIEGVSLDVITPAGAVTLRSPGGEVAQAGGQFTAELPVSVDHSRFRSAGSLRLNAGAGRQEIALALDTLTLPDADPAVQRFGAALAISRGPEALTGTARMRGTIRTDRAPLTFAFDAAANPEGAKLNADLGWGGARLTGSARAEPRGDQPARIGATLRIAALDPALWGGRSGRVDARLEAQGGLAEGAARLRLSATGTAALGNVAVRDVALRGPVNVAVSSGEVRLNASDCLNGGASRATLGSTVWQDISIGCLKDGSGPVLALVARASGIPSLMSHAQLARLSAVRAEVSDPAPRSFALSDLRWAMDRRETGLSGEASGTLRDQAPHPWFAPVTISAVLRNDVPDQIAVAFTASQGAGLLSAQGQAHWGPGEIGGGVVKLGPLRVTPGSGWKARALPGLPGFDEIAGEFECLAEAAWDREGLRSRGKITVHDGMADSGGTKISGIEAALEASALWPLTMPAGQWLRIDEIGTGLPLRNLNMVFGMPSARAIDVREMGAELAGGTIRAQPFRAGLPEGGLETVLSATGLQLSELLKGVKLDGVRGEGRLSGQIPIAVENGRVTVRNALLESGGGTLSYAPDHPPAALSQGQAKLALQALRDFHYDRLQLTLDGVSGGESRAVLSLRGRNPEFYEGQTIQFTLNLSGALDSILRRGLSAYNLPDRVRARIQQLKRNPP